MMEGSEKGGDERKQEGRPTRKVGKEPVTRSLLDQRLTALTASTKAVGVHKIASKSTAGALVDFNPVHICCLFRICPVTSHRCIASFARPHKPIEQQRPLLSRHSLTMLDMTI